MLGINLLVLATASLLALTTPASSPGSLTAAGSGVVGARVGSVASHYRTVDLGTLGGASSQAFGVNDRDQVVGRSDTSDGQTHPFLWQRGRMIDLGLLAGNTGTARAVNSRGQVVGTSDSPSGGQHAFLWHDGTMTDLGTLGGAISAAYDINDHGQVVGVSLTAAGSWHAFRWQDGMMTDLGAFDARRINNRGQIVGTMGDTSSGDPVRAVRWHSGTLTTLTAAASTANDINNAGLIVGDIASTPGTQRGYSWRDGRLTTLASLGGDSVAYAVNDRGRIVGMSSLAATAEQRPVMWVRGAVLDLTTRGLSADSFVVAINDSGHLAGAANGHAALFR